ncbi:MAG: hypothetical protein HW398_627 [Acidobacteria bacterium]|nr:hypothetical protein [Acidobacteriota bacterium]
MDSAPSPRGIAFDLHIASDSARLLVLSRAGVAQLAEHLICNQRVRGSNPFASSKEIRGGPGGLPVKTAEFTSEGSEFFGKQDLLPRTARPM